jgi:Na+/phosphate symporter
MERKRPARISVAYNADVASVLSVGVIRFKAAIAVLLGALVCSVLLAIITGQSSRESNTPAK